MLSQTVLFCVCALSLATGYAPSEPACGYERCTDAAPAPDVLNIHVIATSHDDVGWKQTVHQYYEKDVRIILDSVIKSLHGFPHRRFWLNLGLAPDAMKIYTWMEIWLLMPSSANFIFPLFFKMAYAYIYAEMVYFWMWWSDQDRETRAKVRQLVKSGQLVFVGGGWSVIDEGSTHYQSIIDQLTLGIGKLIEMFGVCHVPRTAWQYDAFGHSREVASLFATVGFDGIFFNRLDDMDRINRGHTLSTETLWRGDDDLDNSSDIFTSVMWVYRLRPHICSDPLHCPSVQDPDVNTTVTDFIDFMSSSSEYYTTRNVALYIVVDFGFRDAPNDFRKLDNVIELTNQKAAQDGLNIKAFYSTPACYLKAVKDAEPALPTKQDDFFPYRTLNRSYTGYYSSRPTIKYFEREGNSYLQMAKQLQVLAGLHDDTKLEIEELKHVMGIMQHHDAITGTQKQHVTNDFEKMLDRAIEGVLIVPQVAINKIMFGDETASPRLLFERCHLNESRCETSETSEQFVVAVYNPLAWHLDAPIRIPVVEGNYVVYGPKGKKVVSQMVEIPPEVLNLPTRMSAATLEIVFIGCFEALMIKTYFIKKIPTNKKETDNSIKIVKKNSAFNYLNGSWKASSKKTDVKNIKKRSTNAQPDNVFGNKFLQLNLNYTSNEITHVTLADGTNIKLNIKFSYYPGSGTPYWFQHDVKKPYDIGPTETSGHKGHVVQEIRITSDTASAVVRIYEGLRYIENEWVVGPIDIKDGKGKDYIIRYVTDIFNSGQFYTDSNGRQTLKRILNKRPQWDVEIDDQVAENYYPVTNKIFIQDDENRVVVLTDRSEGGTSLNEGQIELMLHRRHLVVTYSFGTREALNETANGQGLVVRGKHRIFVTKLGSFEDKLEERKQVFQMHLQPHVFIANAEDLRETDGAIPYDSWMSSTKAKSFATGLPEGVHLLTLEPWDGTKLLLRLENFLEKSDDKSTSVQVDLKSIFKYIQVLSFKETNLSGHQLVNNNKKMTWKIRDNFVKNFNEHYGSNKTVEYVKKDKHVKKEKVYDVGSKVMLKAKQIRTFIVSYKMVPFTR